MTGEVYDTFNGRTLFYLDKKQFIVLQNLVKQFIVLQNLVKQFIVLQHL